MSVFFRSFVYNVVESHYLKWCTFEPRFANYDQNLTNVRSHLEYNFETPTSGSVECSFDNHAADFLKTLLTF